MKSPRGRHPHGFDISHALSGWDFEPGEVNVRLVPGVDGKPKLQMRLDLGLLQMELTGRPDGRRPHHRISELDFQRSKLDKHKGRHGSDNGFTLAPRDCRALREESAMFYHRYLSLFVLEHYDAAVRDTQHNLDVLDLCRAYGRSERDRYMLEQYRPYIMMMQGRARACNALSSGYPQSAIAYLRGTARAIARLYNSLEGISRGQRKTMFYRSDEAKILKDMIGQIRSQLPPDPRKALQERLREAVRTEKYEDAGRLRDQLLAMQTAQVLQHGPSGKIVRATSTGVRRSFRAHRPGKPKPPNSAEGKAPPKDMPPRRRKPRES